MADVKEEKDVKEVPNMEEEGNDEVCKWIH
jgi:hypothetical protein